jgi:signal transduction histidine kinase
VIYTFRRAPDGACSFPFASPAFETFYGVSRQALTRDATPVLSWIHRDDVDGVLASITESGEKLSVWSCEFRVNIPSRGELWVEGRSVPQREDDGSILWYGFLNDISGRKRSELELLRSRELLAAFIDHAPLGIAMFNRNMQYICSSLCWQEAMCAVGGLLEGRHHYDDMPDMSPDWIEAHRRGMAGETVKGEDEWLQPSGKRVRTRWEVHPWGDEGVESGGIIILFEDVTEARSMEAELRHAHKMEALGQLAGGVAHDFNNLLQIVQGYTEMLKEHLAADESGSKYTAEVLRAVRGASSLTRQLLAFSRRQVLSPTILDLNDVIQSTTTMLKRLLSEDIEYRLDLERPLWYTETDADQLSHALINLCVNARDAMPRGGRLTIATRNFTTGVNEGPSPAKLPAGEYVALAVEDTGVGMEAAVIERIFEPFFTTKEAGKGTGLGLSTVYGIVRQFDGHVWVDSTPGEGTCFTIYLPRSRREYAPAPVRAEHASVGGHQFVLVVEDDEDVRRAIADYLPTLGYKVAAAHPSQALALAQEMEGGLDLLITDVVMPEMSGPVLAEKIRALRPGLPTLFMSGYVDDAVTRHGVLESSAPFLQKPFALSDLAAAVRAALLRR